MSVTHVAESFCYEHWEYDELGLRESGTVTGSSRIGYH